VEHDLFGKPVSTHRAKSEGMFFRIMLYAFVARVSRNGMRMALSASS
jgi:hypothetical protein